MKNASSIVCGEMNRAQKKGKLLRASLGLSPVVIRGRRRDGNVSRLRLAKLLEQRQIFFHVAGRSLAGCGRPQFLAESRLQKSRG